MAEIPTFTLEPGAFAVQRNQEGRYDVGQLGEDGTWSWRGTAINPEYAARIVSEALDGAAEARSKRFWAGIQQLITEVRPEVQEIMGTLGFEPEHTGGGCMLWAKPIDQGHVGLDLRDLAAEVCRQLRLRGLPQRRQPVGGGLDETLGRLRIAEELLAGRLRQGSRRRASCGRSSIRLRRGRSR